MSIVQYYKVIIDPLLFLSLSLSLSLHKTSSGLWHLFFFNNISLCSRTSACGSSVSNFEPKGIQIDISVQILPVSNVDWPFRCQAIFHPVPYHRHAPSKFEKKLTYIPYHRLWYSIEGNFFFKFRWRVPIATYALS